jgi:hypothetical protein
MIKGTIGLEYSVVIAVVIAALIGIQIYIKRAVCARWKESGDVFGSGRQYDNDTIITRTKL